MESELRVLVALGFTFLLVMLRLDADRFGVAGYDGAAGNGRTSTLRWRLAWYVTALVLLAVADISFPRSATELYMRVGDRAGAVSLGVAFGIGGTVVAFAIAWVRDRKVHLAPGRLYPGALLSAIASAFVDEAIFRALLLALAIGAGLDSSLAIVGQALVYVLATSRSASGRSASMLALAAIVGLLGGWLTVTTGGIGAAFIGHTVTRFAVFVTTGAGDLADDGWRDDRAPRRRRPGPWRGIGRDGTGEVP